MLKIPVEGRSRRIPLSREPRPGHETTERKNGMGKPNYQFEKRSRELAKKKKKEEKRLRKLSEKGAPPATDTPPPAAV